ncbi:MAG: class I SAM-dependent methyltransferase [Gammaproteobacteria bacterium]|nr:class I SAM-dependent methyltransferase [Gammaproteobacteria bacterium]
MRTAPVIVLAFLSQLAHAQPAPPSAFQQRVLEVMEGELRTEEERARDRNRQPAQVLEFFRLEQDMRVIEVLPFSGWYTKILAPLLEENGKLYVTHPSPTFYSDAFIPVSRLEGMQEVEEIDWNGSAEPGGTPFFAPGPWDVEPVDLVLTFRNYHNFSPAARMAMNESSIGALKPGGYYGIVDHTRRHMEPDNPENGRRVDPVQVIKEVQQAGFELVDYSTVLRRPDDELRYEVGRRSVTGNSDRFALLFRKPD